MTPDRDAQPTDEFEMRVNVTSVEHPLPMAPDRDAHTGDAPTVLAAADLRVRGMDLLHAAGDLALIANLADEVRRLIATVEQVTAERDRAEKTVLFLSAFYQGPGWPPFHVNTYDAAAKRRDAREALARARHPQEGT